ncbi:hypothetical protein [uncultured Sphingomonas sp.]|uniref:hypothetical protein n=1 Tax=uncultured Sphingomonas sp. TaxID=158754 RepID=UPI0035CAC05F
MAEGTRRPPTRSRRMDRATIEARWRRLTREELPALAALRGWPVRADHCFQRILLDHAVGGCWYDHVSGCPAYRHLATARLLAAVTMAEAVAAGELDLHQLNRQSLAWRRASKGGVGERGRGSGEQRDAGTRERQQQRRGGGGEAGHGERS